MWTSIGNRKTGRHLTREQYANQVKTWSSLARIDPKRHSTHSMRRTNPAVIYDKTQKHRISRPAITLLGHRNISLTAHCLGVDQRKALDLAKRIKI